MQSDSPECGIKSLCPTCWTVRTEAMDSVIVLMETMEEVHHTTRDKYGLKAAGVLAALEKFGSSAFWCSKDMSVREAVIAV